MKATRQTAHIRALLALFLALLMLLSMAACGTKGDKGNEESTSTDTDSETTDGFLDLEITDTKTIYCNLESFDTWPLFEEVEKSRADYRAVLSYAEDVLVSAELRDKLTNSLAYNLRFKYKQSEPNTVYLECELPRLSAYYNSSLTFYESVWGGHSCTYDLVYEFDKNELLQKASLVFPPSDDPNAITTQNISYEYTENGNLACERFGDRYTKYEYDKKGNLIYEETVDGKYYKTVISYSYQNGRLTEKNGTKTRTNSEPNEVTSVYHTTYKYDEQQNKTETIYENNTIDTIDTVNVWNAHGDLLKYIWYHDGQISTQEETEYDERRNLLSKKITTDGKTQPYVLTFYINLVEKTK